MITVPAPFRSVPALFRKGAILNVLVTCRHQVRGLSQSGTPGETRSLEHCLPNVAVAAVPFVRARCCSLMAEGPSLPHALVACLHLVGPGTWSAPSSWPHFTNGVFLQRLVTCLHQASFRKQVADNPITPGLRLLSPASVRHALQMLVALCGLLRVA